MALPQASAADAAADKVDALQDLYVLKSTLMADALDATRQNLSAHRAAIQEALTQIDLAFRQMLTQLSADVAALMATVNVLAIDCAANAATFSTAVESLNAEVAALRADVTALAADHVAHAQALANVATLTEQTRAAVTSLEDVLT